MKQYKAKNMSYNGGRSFIHQSNTFNERSTPNCSIAVEFAKNRCRGNEFINKDGKWNTEFDRVWLSGMCTQSGESVYVDVSEIHCIGGPDECGSVFLGRCFANEQHQMKKFDSCFNKE